MINNALINPRNTLNSFTSRVANGCDRFGSKKVQLRNGEVVEVCYYQTTDKMKTNYFYSANLKYNWFLDGSNVKHSDYDMIMIGSDKLLSTDWRIKLEDLTRD